MHSPVFWVSQPRWGGDRRVGDQQWPAGGGKAGGGQGCPRSAYIARGSGGFLGPTVWLVPPPPAPAQPPPGSPPDGRPRPSLLPVVLSEVCPAPVPRGKGPDTRPALTALGLCPLLAGATSSVLAPQAWVQARPPPGCTCTPTPPGCSHLRTFERAVLAGGRGVRRASGCPALGSRED